MRSISTALLLACLAAPIAQAQTTTPQAQNEPQPAYTQQASSNDDSKDKKETYKEKRKEQKEVQTAQPAQSNCVPGRNPVGEGDPDAPQNHVEYGGGG